MNPDDTKFADEKELDEEEEEDEGTDENSPEPNMNKTLKKPKKPDNNNKTSFNTTFCFPRSTTRMEKENFENTSVWSVSAAVDSPYKLKRVLKREDELKLKSELQLKTEQLMEK
jgi:hypothetical protein